MIFIRLSPFRSEQRVFRVPVLDAHIGNDDHQEPEQRLEQARRGAKAHAQGLGGGDAVHIGIEDVGRVEQGAVVANQLVEQLELAFHDATQSVKQQDNEGGLEQRDGDIADLLVNIRAVDLGGFIVFRADPGDGGQIHHHAVADVLP